MKSDTLALLTKRVIIGKLIGFCVGIIGATYLIYATSVTTLFILGILFWYTTFGAIIAAFSIFNYHIILHMRIIWWLRAVLLGAWLNFVITLFAYNDLQHVILEIFGTSEIITSPFWFVLEGAIVALCIEYVFKKYIPIKK